MWRVKAAGLVAGFAMTCTGYYRVFALDMFDARAAQEKRYEAIEQRLSSAAHRAMKAVPVGLNVVAQAAPPPSSQ
ncbi:hypothetical protein NXY56_005839 [Leishmania guyanensis]|uniref:Uncharacterized protein n=1 Tax=Leishmania shawi TaxID=5680 RepID=A0AAW3BEX8_9TRYP